MKITIQVPQRLPEIDWICSVIFGDFLGLDFVLIPAPVLALKLLACGRSLEMPDVFFAQAYAAGPGPRVLPTTPLGMWDSRSCSLMPVMEAAQVPVLFGNSARSTLVSANHVYLPLDIIGSAFFMLSRYEERGSDERDEHGRFPDAASLACRANFAHRPIVDEYVEILWSAIAHLWPDLRRRVRRSCPRISCDVDLPFDPAAASLLRLGKRLLGSTWRLRSLRAAPTLVHNFLRQSRGDDSQDPYRTAIDWMMALNRDAGNRMAFNIIPLNTDRRFDRSAGLDEPRMRSLIRSIHRAGHEIGIHPGYNTYRHPNEFARSVATLRSAMLEEEIVQPELGGRQHYLRWQTPTTAQLWEENGLDYDSSLSFSERPGFRCGTSHEYRMYDLALRRPLRLRQRPLITMEIIRYQGKEYQLPSHQIACQLKTSCARYNGNFSMLWHNSYFELPESAELYRAIISDK